MLNKGKWESNVILNDTTYLNNQVNTSQNLNLSYGYLTWLNGKSSYRYPSIQIVFNGGLIPNAPSDLYAALGKNDQKIYVVPSKKLVVIRMGNSAGNPSLALSNFDNELWAKLSLIIKD
jgi:CubicO group peptidase (beta-lactamase class C family)